MWIQVEDIHNRKSCINLDYISCINPNENSVDIVFSDGAVARIKPTFIGKRAAANYPPTPVFVIFLQNPIQIFVEFAY